MGRGLPSSPKVQTLPAPFARPRHKRMNLARMKQHPHPPHLLRVGISTASLVVVVPMAPCKYIGVIGKWVQICKGTIQLHCASDGGVADNFCKRQFCISQASSCSASMSMVYAKSLRKSERRESPVLRPYPVRLTSSA